MKFSTRYIILGIYETASSEYKIGIGMEMRVAINRHPDDKEKRPCTAAEIIVSAYNLKLPGTWRANTTARGDCHSVVHGLLGLLEQVRKVDGWMVVQADIPGGQGWHSWLEYDNWVVDFASGTYAISDVGWYYENKRPTLLRRLTPQEFQQKWKTETGKWWLSNPPE